MKNLKKLDFEFYTFLCKNLAIGYLFDTVTDKRQD